MVRDLACRGARLRYHWRTAGGAYVMRQSLSGTWHFRLDRDAHWLLIEVPGCWESLGVAKNDPGPAWYRREVHIPPEWAGKRIWLRFEGVSYACEVFVREARRASPAAHAAPESEGAHRVGEHVGLWDGFRLEITDAAKAGEAVELLVRVEKPASLTAGPDSPHLPGRFPQRETLCGFLPYVWGHMFGGIWQDVWLEATERIVIEDLCIRGDHAGNVRGEVRLSAEAEVELEIFDPSGKPVLKSRDHGRDLLFIEKVMPPTMWTLASPALYEARISVAGGEVRTQRFGMRSLRADRARLLLNEQPVYPRMILSWGWYEQTLYANPGREQVRRDFERLRHLGYNGVKLCLWIPPEYYFEVADEVGMLLWLELPMWMPELSEFFLKQTSAEYERIVRQVRHHPSIVLYTLGCELDAQVRADFLEPLYRQTKSLIGDALLRDNSGSGEAYGGLLDEYADFYDYHFYSDLQFFRPLLDHFAPRWRPAQPLLFGEFCDMDTWRDLRKLPDEKGEMPWWAQRDEQLNPQGARWQFDIFELEDRVRAAGLWDRQDELVDVSHKQAMLHRKFTIELVRTYREVSGYVVTGERDTPISTSGVWTGAAEGGEQFKFDPAKFAAFNSDVALSLGWDKRRAWIAGGDRAAYWDTFSYAAGSVVRAHLIVSNYGASTGLLTGSWTVDAVAQGSFEREVPLPSGEVREVAIAQFVAPEVDRPIIATLRARVKISESTWVENEWPLWFFPHRTDIPTVRLIDPAGRLDSVGRWLRVDNTYDIVLATQWTPAVRKHVESGGRAILLQSGSGSAGPVRAAAMPFWREAIKLIEPHAAWGDFPHDGFCDLQFFGLATDFALDSANAQGARPILRRVDARTAAVHDYATELSIGAGRVIISTLRFEGGAGEQPLGLSRNTAAAYLLSCWVRYLSAAGRPHADA